MAQYRLYIDTDNDAFTHEDTDFIERAEADEVVRILRKLAADIEMNGELLDGKGLLDINGHVVGRAYRS